MIQTSDKYKENIKGDTELIQCRAELSFVPPGATEGTEISTTECLSVAHPQQLKNGSFGMDANWGTLEHKRIVLDGSVSFIPKNNAQQIGFFSAGMCDSEGYFSPAEEVTYTFDALYDIAGVSIAFDDLGGEWAEELDIKAYDGADALLSSLSFINNKALFYTEIRQRNVKKLVFSFKKWNKGLRYCKVSQIVPGIILSFASEGIFELDFEESIDPFSSSLRFPETTLVFDNTDNEFNIINPDGFASFLRQKMKTVPKLDLIVGARTDSIGMGQFYLYSFPKTDQPNEAKVYCRPSIAFELGNYKNDGRGLQTVEQAVSILFANIQEPVVIDEELKNIQVNQYIGDDIPIHTAMAYLAIACCGYWKFERDGSYSLKKWKLPEVMTNDIDYENMWSKPSISMGERYTCCTVRYYYWDSTNSTLKGTDVTVKADEDDGQQLSITSYYICSEAQAVEVAQAYMAFKNLRLTHIVDYRGDMSIEAADSLTIQNDFTKSKVIVMTHSLTFDTEGLTGTITGRGLD